MTNWLSLDAISRESMENKTMLVFLQIETWFLQSVCQGDWNLQEWKMTDHQKMGVEFAGLENDGLENDGVEQEQQETHQEMR